MVAYLIWLLLQGRLGASFRRATVLEQTAREYLQTANDGMLDVAHELEEAARLLKEELQQGQAEAEDGDHSQEGSEHPPQEVHMRLSQHEEEVGCCVVGSHCIAECSI